MTDLYTKSKDTGFIILLYKLTKFLSKKFKWSQVNVIRITKHVYKSIAY